MRGLPYYSNLPVPPWLGGGKMLSIYFMLTFYPEAVSVTTNAPHLGILVRHVKDARMPCPLACLHGLRRAFAQERVLLCSGCQRREKIQPSGVCAAFLLPCQPLTSVPGCSFCLSVGQRLHLFSHMPVLSSVSLRRARLNRLSTAMAGRNPSCVVGTSRAAWQSREMTL